MWCVVGATRCRRRGVSQFRDATFHAEKWGRSTAFTFDDDDLQYLAESAVFDVLALDSCSQTTLGVFEAVKAIDPAFADLLTKAFIYRTYKKYDYTFKDKSSRRSSSRRFQVC